MVEDLVDEHLKDWLSEFPDIDTATEGLIARIHKLSRYIERSLGETAAAFGLTIWDWDLLGSLRRVGSPYSLTHGQLAERLAVSPGAMTGRIDRLESRGLVERRPDPDDRRVMRVVLTPDGSALWNEAVEVQAAKEALIADALTDPQKATLNDLLRKLMLKLQAAEGPPPTRAVIDSLRGQ